MEDKGLMLAPILSNGMILQRDSVNPIYGRETIKDVVTVSFLNKEYASKVDDKREFYIELPPVNAGGPYEMLIKGSSTIILSDIWFGDVYILSGQSNMELPVRRVLDVSAAEIRKTQEPTIRQYLIPATYNFKEPERYMCKSSWKKAVGEELLDFSAAGYFFAKEIKDTFHIPIGLIQTAVGGSKIEAWMKEETLRQFGNYEEEIRDFKDIDYFKAFIEKQQSEANWWLNNLEKEEEVLNINNYKDWDTCMVPSLISDYGIEPFCGSLYLYKEVIIDDGEQALGLKEDIEKNLKDIEKELTKREEKTWAEEKEEDYLYMGSIIDSDQVWINGTLIGRTEYRYPPRKYKIPAGVIKEGRNKILVRVVINHNNGGTIKDKPYYLYRKGHKYDLSGEWHYRIGKKAEKEMPQVLFPPVLPVCFYNTAVAPLSKVRVKGVLWCQGESNTEEPVKYSEKFTAMVKDWREVFKAELPFVYAGLANYREPLNDREDTGWAWLRDEQRKCLAVKNTAMAVTLDIGEANDLHPQNKKEVGLRLARGAKHLIYHQDIPFSGPIPETAVCEGKSVIIRFLYLEDKKEDNSWKNTLKYFEVAGEDSVFYQAEALRKGAYVYLSCKEVKAPVKIRYAWCDNPEGVNFYNEGGLPAAGFYLELPHIS